jgi:hypothetical protein
LSISDCSLFYFFLLQSTSRSPTSPYLFAEVFFISLEVLIPNSESLQE